MKTLFSERWVQIFDGIYAVSSLGRIRRLKGWIAGCGGCRKATGLLKPVKRHSGTGYLWVTLSIQGKQIQRSVASLVMEAFVGPRPFGMTINHKDANSLNNELSNLEYVTMAENTMHARRFGLTHRELSIEKVREMRALAKERCHSVRELTLRFKVSETTVRDVLSRRSWAWLN